MLSRCRPYGIVYIIMSKEMSSFSLPTFSSLAGNLFRNIVVTVIVIVKSGDLLSLELCIGTKLSDVSAFLTDHFCVE